LAPPELLVRPRAILVPVDGSHASLQAVALACEFGHKHKSKVFAVHVIEVKRTLPLDAEIEGEETRGDEILSRAERVAKDQGHSLDGEILHAREAGPAIVDDAIERGVQLIVMGMEYPERFGEFELGRVVQYVLRAAPCEVWLCRHQPQE
jgi:nucleotide-binding universal stress UspA family protein